MERPKGETRGIKRVKSNKFSRTGSGFAGEFHCRFYSCSFDKFVVQMPIDLTPRQDGLIRLPCGIRMSDITPWLVSHQPRRARWR